MVRSRKFSMFLMGILVLSISSFAFGQSSCRTTSSESRFGVVEPLGWTGLYPPERMAQVFDMMAEASVGWVRLNWAWKDMQPVAGPFDYTHYDMIATMAAEHQIEVLPILFTVPAWASTAPPELIAERGNLSPVDRYRPQDMNTWLTYVRNVVERYDGDGVDDAPGSPRLRYWEVWNEQNIPLYWPPQPDVEEYIALLAATHAVIHGADPTATIVLGGLAGGGAAYLQQVYNAGGSEFFEVVSTHIYSHPMFGVTPVQASVEAVRAVMDAKGDDATPLWLTETGWSDAENAWGAPTASPLAIAAFLNALYTTPMDTEVVFWYNFRDIFPNSPDVEHNFGLLEADFSLKPAFEVYAALAQSCQ